MAPCLILVVVAGLIPRTLAEELKRVDFNFQIRPLLSDRCFKCHGPDEKARKKKLRLDMREGILKELEDGWAVVKPGDPAKSEMVRRIFATDED
ncbi:MAG TPA: c-type cytochrome domain-containing protein, partial [Verrucomicrobiae bacterium]|nr:c-type cytochrome domain-containing protein [Verrucomicrobiae bacterium]